MKKQRQRQKKLREKESIDQTKTRLDKAKEYKQKFKLNETKKQRYARLKADSDYQWQRRKIIKDAAVAFGTRVLENSDEEFKDETEKKLCMTHYKLNESSKNRKRSRKAAMSKEKLNELFLIILT